MEPVLDAIEMELRREKDWVAGSVETVYFGGGTPSLCAPERLGRIVETIKDLWKCEPKEVTVECNPDDLTSDYLDGLKSAGVNRVSVGIQSFDDGDLRLMGRRHDSAAALKAVEDAKKWFDNVSIDLIFGIPNSDSWERNLHTAISLGVQHISAYHLTIEAGTPFSRTLRPVDEEVSEREFNLLHRMLTGAGYEHYEVSNFALAGYRARHNSSYWRGEPYLGVGPGAHSYDGRMRRSFAGTIGEYLSGEPYAIENLSEKDRRNELIMTRLRTAEGIKDHHLTPSQAAPFLERGLLVHGEGHYRIPPHKFLLSDIVIAGLFE